MVTEWENMTWIKNRGENCIFLVLRIINPFRIKRKSMYLIHVQERLKTAFVDNYYYAPIY